MHGKKNAGFNTVVKATFLMVKTTFLMVKSFNPNAKPWTQELVGKQLSPHGAACVERNGAGGSQEVL